MKIRVTAEYGEKVIGSVIDTDDRIEAVKIFMEKLQESGKAANIHTIHIDTDVEYI